VVEIVLSRAWSRLRPFVPPESAGLVVFLVGCIIGLAALRVLLEDEPTGALDGRDCIVAGCALAVMAALNIWSRGWPKLFCILIGMVVGYLVAGAVGLLGMDEVTGLLHGPFFAAPSLSGVSWRFEWSLAVPFAVTGIAAAMNTTAVVATYQRLTDAEWVRPDMTSIGRGVLGDGIATVIAGLSGTYGVTVSSANVGLVAATGVASRVIGFAVAAMLAVAALQPTLIGVLIIMPRPVMAAAMLFTAVFIMISGVQIISTRVLDGRRTLVVGMGIIAFFVDSVYPRAFSGTPWWAQPLVTSPLVLATLVALSLNLLFRIGIRRTVTATVDAAAPYVQPVSDLIERQAGVWGARRDVTSRVEFAVQQTIEAVIAFCGAHGAIRLEVSFDEFVIQAVVAYVGTPLVFPTHAPTRDEILEADDGQQRLAGFLVRRYADSVTTTARDSLNAVRLRFDH
jgi:NCS2 family nucleobase:cation symporter-2